MTKVRLAILISGRGSNMESILKSIKKKKIPINPAVVISNKPDAKGLKIAQKLGVSIEVVESKGFKGNRAEYDKQIISVLTNEHYFDSLRRLSFYIGFTIKYG